MKNSPKKKVQGKYGPTIKKKSKVQQTFLHFLTNSITSISNWSISVFWA